MATLALKSENQIVASILSQIFAATGINDANPGSFLRVLAEAVAREDFQQYVQMLTIIRNFNLDTTTGVDLENKAFEFGLERREALKASGNISILREESFTKVATTFYAGFPSPISGNTTIYVNDASDALYGTSGTLIIGRDTDNEEEVTYSVAPVDNTNYWVITLDGGLSNDHGLDETVILKQGSDELIIAGTVVIVPASGGSAQITFTTNQDVTLLAGEERIDNVEVTAAEAGADGNIPIGTIDGEEAFTSPPFAGARAENDSKFTTGRDRETDDELRDRIKNHIQSLSRGVKIAILNAIVGLVDQETAKRVVSANVVLPTNPDEPVKVYIDDGTGFEPTFENRGFESLLASATGGELRFQLDLIPMVKAQVESNLAEPFDMSSGALTLIYNVGTESETITFNPDDFDFPSAATAEEIVRAINDKASLIEARTSQVGTQIVITARRDENEDIQVTGGTANSILQFPTDLRSTLFLYKNDRLLSKDGATAFIDSGNQENYDFDSLGAAPWPLNIIVDGKSANPQVVNFVAADFIDPSEATADEVVVAINDRLAGATASLVSNDTAVRIVSNQENSSGSKLEVTGGSANTILGFSTSEVVGKDRDYTLNRFLGIIELAEAADVNDSFTAGSQFTRAFLRTAAYESYSINSGETLLVDVDGIGNQTITFPSTGVFTAQEVADEINSQLYGATATVREIGGFNYLEITTNTYAEANGSLEIDSASTASALQFDFDTLVENQRPHKAYSISGNSAPYIFVETQNLVVVIDDDPISKTFQIIMDFDGSVTSGASTTVFAASAFNQIFLSDDELVDFWCVFKSGANTTTGTVTDVQDQGGNTFRYVFDSLPANLADFASGDQVTLSGLSNNGNNGTFLVTAVNTSGSGYIEVTNAAGVDEIAASGSALIGQRRQITDYVAATGQMTVGSALRATPSASDSIVVIPSSLNNMIDYFNNTKITTISTKGVIEAADGNTKVQISSKSRGSDGAVQVTGGTANPEMGFSTSLFIGLQGYSNYTGLLELVHKTIYGDDRDLISFPGVGAAGVDFNILAPTVREVSFNLDVTLSEGVSLSNVEDEIRSAITGYINSLDVGEDVIIEEVRCSVISVSNVVDVVLNSPTANIAIEDGEIARTRDSLIVIG